MTSIRRHIGAWTLAWLIVQIASVCVIAVFDATRSAHTLAEAQKDCLGQGPAEQCPMHDANGNPCPMHRGAETTSHHNDPTCALRGTDYDGGMLASVFSLPGVLLGDVSAILEISSPVPAAESFRIPPAPVTHDTPPPRA
jgi:hypothetical protein